MQLEAAKFLKNVANCAGIEASIYEDYSGRGMFNRTTTGIVTESAIALLGAAIEHVSADAADGMSWDINKWELYKLSTDSMGRNEILY